MSVDIGVVVISSVLPLLGVLVGTAATVFGQRSTTRESRIRSEEERRQTRRAEIKSVISVYLEAAQHLQTQLYAREHGREVSDIPVMVEQIWLAHAQVDIVCSERLRDPLVRHATVLNEVARHEEDHPDWWKAVLPYKAILLDAIREELELTGSASPRAAADGPDGSRSLLSSYLSMRSELKGKSARDDFPQRDR